MKVFLAGATGFIGGHALRALVARGHEVTCLVRPRPARQGGGHGSAHASALSELAGVRVVEGLWTAPATWLQHVAGHDAALNAVGVIRETRGARFEAVHTVAPVALFEEAARAGARKVVQVSAMGADEGAVSRYHRSKRAADQRLAALGVPFVVLRPSVVYGPGDHSMTFFSRLAALPLTPVPGDGRYLLQPLHVDDLVRALVLATERDSLSGLTLDVGGGQALSFDELLTVLAHRTWRHGRAHDARLLHVPWNLMRLVAATTDLLGGHGPITGEELGMLRRGNAGDNGPFVAQFGFTPRPFVQGNGGHP